MITQGWLDETWHHRLIKNYATWWRPISVISRDWALRKNKVWSKNATWWITTQHDWTCFYMVKHGWPWWWWWWGGWGWGCISMIHTVWKRLYGTDLQYDRYLYGLHLNKNYMIHDIYDIYIYSYHIPSLFYPMTCDKPWRLGATPTLHCHCSARPGDPKSCCPAQARFLFRWGRLGLGKISKESKELLISHLPWSRLIVFSFPLIDLDEAAKVWTNYLVMPCVVEHF